MLLLMILYEFMYSMMALLVLHHESKYHRLMYLSFLLQRYLNILIYHLRYSNSVKTIDDKYMHLTNYSINKSNKEYKSNNDEKACFGHKW